MYAKFSLANIIIMHTKQTNITHVCHNSCI